MHPKVSIITVVYNGASLIERTILSVANQTYKNIEYIIIDGASKDGTIDIIDKYKCNISSLINEPDKGLYDAMNKGLNIASGEYVWFLNAGDTIFEKNTLEQIINSKKDSDIYYGETLIVDNDGNEIGNRRLKAPDNLTWRSFKNGMLVCHQSILIRKSITSKYNLKYKVSADFDWVLNALKKAKNIKNAKQNFTCFLDGGINKQKIPQGLRERFMIMIKYYGLISTIIYHIPIAFRFLWFLIINKRF